MNPKYEALLARLRSRRCDLYLTRHVKCEACDGKGCGDCEAGKVEDDVPVNVEVGGWVKPVRATGPSYSCGGEPAYGGFYEDVRAFHARTGVELELTEAEEEIVHRWALDRRDE